MDDLNKKKYDFLLFLLEEGDAMVCLDSRNEEVDVPKSHKNNSSLNLVFNLNFRHPMDITEEGIFATLAFNGRPYKCVLPFSAVWAIYDPNMKNGQVWEESIPEDMSLAGQGMKNAMKNPTTNPAEISTESPKPQTKLKAMKSSRKPTSEPQTKGKRDRNHLWVIK
jgi:stringent starvation protein B